MAVYSEQLTDGPDAGKIMIFARHYDWFTTSSSKVKGKYVWDEKREGYRFITGEEEREYDRKYWEESA